MTINMTRHRDEMKKTFEQLGDDQSPINWMLLSYEQNSNALKLSSFGEGGLEELLQQFDCGKLQYGISKVQVPDCNFNKLVLIHWQGESMPIQQLSICASHAREVERFFKGVHTTHFARNEEDIDPEAILKSLSNVTSNLGWSKTLSNCDKQTPVGSVYKPVKPTSELAPLAERQKFWAQTAVKGQDEAERCKAEQRRQSQNAASVEIEKQKLQERLSKECAERIGKVKLGADLSKSEGKNGPLPKDAPEGSRTKKSNEEQLINVSEPEEREENEELRARALWEYEAADDTEISFAVGDMISSIVKVDCGWWMGTAPNNSRGLFPANYVKLLPQGNFY